jgi:acyl carrier protein
VLGVDDELLGEDLVAVVVPEGPASEESIRGLLDGAIDRMKIPSRIHLVDELPRLRSGKVDKNALRDMVQHELSSRAWSGGQEPGPGDREALSRAMRDIWERALRRKVSDRDDFYALGGDSLATVGILSAAEAHLGFGVDLADVYPFGTLDDFVAALRRVLVNRRVRDRSLD